jgi:hypothetical protein
MAPQIPVSHPLGVLAGLDKSPLPCIKDITLQRITKVIVKDRPAAAPLPTFVKNLNRR